MRLSHILNSRPVPRSASHVAALLLRSVLTALLGGCGSLASTSPGDPNAAAPAVMTTAARAAFGAGVAAYQRGELADAVTQFQIAAEGATPAPAAVVNLALAQQASGDLLAALATLSRPVPIPSCDIDVARGLTERRLGKLNDAAQSYQRCLTREPANGAAWRNLGVLNEVYLGNPGAALAAYKHVQEAQSAPDAEVANWIAALEGATVSAAP